MYFRPQFKLKKRVLIQYGHNKKTYTQQGLLADSIHGRLSPETILKIEQLKRLVYKYPQYQNNDPDGITRWVIYNSINGDYTLLDTKLEQLRTIDSLAKYYAS